MPLTPLATDKLLKVGLPGTATTLAAPGYTNGVTTAINVGATTNWPTDTPTIFAMDAVTVTNGVATRTPGTYGEFFGIVTSSTTIGSLLLRYGTPQNYVAGSLTRVYIPVAGTRENDLIDAIRQDHNGKGNHQSLTDDNGLVWLERGQVASAVNNVKATNAITGKDPRLTASGTDTNISLQLDGKGTGVAVARNPELCFDHIVYGTGIWSGLGYGTTLTATMTAATCYINGRRILIAAVATRTFTASKDTYVDVLDNLDGTGTIVYTEVANNAASPALAANSVRMAIIVSGATIVNVGSINQGEENKVLPIASSIAYTTTDSLGNLICPRDPNRKILGYRQIVANSNTTVAGNPGVAVTGLTVPVIVPLGRKVRVHLFYGNHANNGTNNQVGAAIWDGAVTSGTELNRSVIFGITSSSSYETMMLVEVMHTPTVASKTYTASMFSIGGGTTSLVASAVTPSYIMVELV